MATSPTPNKELGDATLKSDSESVRSNESYDFVDDNVVDVASVEDSPGESPRPGDGDVNSVISDESISILNNYVGTSDKNEKLASDSRPTAEKPQDNEEFDSFDADAHLSKIRSQLQNHCKGMLQIFDDAPSPVDTCATMLINKQLREYSRAIAVMFGDDISALKKMIHARGKEHAELRTLLAIERSSASKEKHMLQERLRQIMAQHNDQIQNKEVEIQKKLADLNEALSRARSQKQRAEKSELDMATTMSHAHFEAEKLKKKHVADMVALEICYNRAVSDTKSDFEAANQKKTGEINELHKQMDKMAKNDEDHTTRLSQKHKEAISALKQQNDNAIKTMEEQFEVTINRITKAAKVDLRTKDRIIHGLSQNDADYTARLCQKYEDNIIDLETEHLAAMRVQKSQHKDDLDEISRTIENNLNSLARRHEEEIQGTKAEYELRLSEKDKEYRKYANVACDAITEHQQKHESYCTALQKIHDPSIAQKNAELADMKAKADKIQSASLQTAGMDRISSLNAELFAVTAKAEACRKEKEASVEFLKAQNHALAQQRNTAKNELAKCLERSNTLTADLQRDIGSRIINQHHCWKLLGKSAEKVKQLTAENNNLKGMVQVASWANAEKKIEPNIDPELLEFRKMVPDIIRVNKALSVVYKADDKIQENQTLKEQLRASQERCQGYEQKNEILREKLVEKGEELRNEFDQVRTRTQVLGKEANAAYEKIVQLEKDGEEVAAKYLALLDEKKKLVALCAVQGKEQEDMHDAIADFVAGLYEAKDDKDFVTEILNSYADNVISGDLTDIQGEWDIVLTEIDRVLHEPYNLLAQFVERLNKHSEVEIDENGEELDMAQLYTDEMSKRIEEFETEVLVMEAKKDAAVCNVNKLRSQLEETRGSANKATKRIEELESDKSVLEAIKDCAIIDYRENRQENEGILDDIAQEAKEIEDATLKEYILLQPLEVAERDIKNLQMVVFHAEQRAGTAEAELRGIGQDIEEYRKRKCIQGSIYKIDRLTGHGARDGVDEMLWLQDLDNQELNFEIEQHKEVEKKLEAMAKDVEDILQLDGICSKSGL